MDQYDAIVVGAGPAGSQTARLLAQRGHRVLVLEEHAAVGTPVHCSGFVTPRTLTEAGVSQDVVLNAIRGAVIYSPGGRALALGGDKVRALVVDRCAFDRRVAEGAQAAGAEVRLGARVVDLAWTEGGAEVAAVQRRALAGYRARLVVGADGVRSRVARSIGRASGEMIWCMSAEVRLAGHPSDMVRVYVGRELAPGWFGWSIPLGSGRARIGIGGVMGPGAPKPRHLFNALLRSYPSHFSGLEVESFGGGFIPLYGRARSYGDRVLLVGDAALQAKPTSGGGIYPGLVAARHAAIVADQALRRDRLSAAALAGYEEGWREELGQELARGADVRRAFLALSDAGLDRLVAVFDQPFLRPLIQQHGDIDYPSRMFARLWAATPLLGALLELPGRIPTRWARLLHPSWTAR